MLVTWTFWLLHFFAHPIHLSVAEMEYKKESKTLEIAIKFFLDDMEAALNEKQSSKALLGEKNEHPEAKKRLEEYMLSKLSITQHFKPIKVHFLGSEIEEDCIWVYLECREVKDGKSLEIDLDFFYELFGDQNNLLLFKSQGLSYKCAYLESTIAQSYELR